MLRWLWAIVPPTVWAVLSDVVIGFVFMAVPWNGILMLAAHYLGMALVAGWAGWRAERQDAGGLWGAALAGGATTIIYCGLSIGMSWLALALLPVPLPDGSGVQARLGDFVSNGSVGLLFGFAGGMVSARSISLAGERSVPGSE